MRTSDGCILHLQLVRRVWGGFKEPYLIAVGGEAMEGSFPLITGSGLTVESGLQGAGV